MPTVAVDLHVHERRGSGDSRTPASAMAETMFDRYGPFTAIGFVGHDTIVEAHAPDTLAIDGVEHEPNPGRWLHIIELVDHDFRILAHPAKTFHPARVKEEAERAAREHGCQAVEKWNWGSGGGLQYEGSIDGVIEVAGSDAHSPLGVGLNHMLVDVDEVSEAAVMREVMAGRFDVVVQRMTGRRVFHTLEKAAALVTKRLRQTPQKVSAWPSAKNAARD